MKIELKNVKYAAFASEETNCFSATVYIDGVKAGEVSNDGRGGCDMFHPFALQEKLDAYAKTLPLIDCTRFGGKGTMPESAETVIGDLFNEWLEARENKRLCARKTCFRKPNETYKKGEWHTVKAKFSPDVKDFLVNKYGPTVQILNEQLAGGAK